jgi:mRNA interferase MazF
MGTSKRETPAGANAETQRGDPMDASASVRLGRLTATAPQAEQSVRRGDIYYADLSPVVGSEQGGIRPVLIVQNNVGNRHSPTVIAAAITSQIGKARLPTHIELSARTYGLSRDSVILLEQVRTIDKKRLKERMGRLDESLMDRVDSALTVSFGLNA